MAAGTQRTEVQINSLNADSNLPFSGYLQLPLAQLGSLKELQLGFLPWRPGPEAAYTAAQPRADLSTSRNRSSRQGVERLTALTHLQLMGPSVRFAGLSALTGLRELECGGVDGKGFVWADAIPDFGTAVADLVAAFLQLQRLTSLTLRDDIASTAVVAQLSALQSLQQLELDDAACHNIPALPQSLKRLTVVCSEEGRLRCGSLTASNAAGLSQLTALQSLDLRCARPLDLALLGGMHNLRSLQLDSCNYASAGGLQVVSRFTALTSLSIEVADIYAPLTITAAEAGALTSSSQLAQLTLSGRYVRLQDLSSLFPPGRQLQHLTLLHIRADLLSNPTAVRQAGSCCPNLQRLSVDWVGNCSTFDNPSSEGPWQAGEQDCLAAGLAGLAGWREIYNLRLTAHARFPGPVWESLGTLTQLTSLHVTCMPEPGIDLRHNDVLRLASCRQLQDLTIQAEGVGMLCNLHVHSTAPLGSPPNLGQRLPVFLKTCRPTFC